VYEQSRVGRATGVWTGWYGVLNPSRDERFFMMGTLILQYIHVGGRKFRGACPHVFSHSSCKY